jgi:hypothetical protein
MGGSTRTFAVSVAMLVAVVSHAIPGLAADAEPGKGACCFGGPECVGSLIESCQALVPGQRTAPHDLPSFAWIVMGLVAGAGLLAWALVAWLREYHATKRAQITADSKNDEATRTVTVLKTVAALFPEETPTINRVIDALLHPQPKK